MYYSQHSNTSGTVGQEVGEAGTQGWGQLVLGQAPQTVFGCPASVLQLPQVLSQLLKVYLEKQGSTLAVPLIRRHCLRLPLPGWSAWAIGTQTRSSPCPSKVCSLLQETDKSI